MLRSDKLEIDAMARALIRQYGAEAEIIAAGHADTMLDVGDVIAFETWKAVMAFIHRLQAGQAHHL